jgi:hypothetical protein
MRNPPFWLLVLPCAGWTQCGYFSTINIPATDTVDPAVHGMVYDANLNLLDTSFFADPPLSVPFPGQGVTFYPIVSTTDDGGVQELEVSVHTSWSCCQNTKCTGPIASASFGTTYSEIQAPAFWVSNGIWLDDVVSFTCPANSPYIRTYSRTYTGFGVDFAGNSYERALGGVYYP